MAHPGIRQQQDLWSQVRQMVMLAQEKRLLTLGNYFDPREAQQVARLADQVGPDGPRMVTDESIHVLLYVQDGDGVHAPVLLPLADARPFILALALRDYPRTELADTLTYREGTLPK